MTHFDNLGRALRYLRDERNLRQYHVAEAASVTKAMLSSYETGKQKPSLETLGKLLDALDCDLYSLAGALGVFDVDAQTGDRRAVKPIRVPPIDPRPPVGAVARIGPGDVGSGSTLDVEALLDLETSLPPEQEAALRDVLGGFHRLMRHLYTRGGREE